MKTLLAATAAIFLLLCANALAQSYPSPAFATINRAIFYPTGAKFDGTTDDTAAIQTAVNTVEAAPQGGILQFPCASAVISSTIIVNASNVHLRGCGIGNDWTSSTTVAGGTTLIWNGASGGTMVQIAPAAGASTPLYDSDAQGIILNGQNVAGIGWDLASIRNGTWNIGFAHFATAGVILDTANVSGSPSLQGNDFTIIGDVRDTSANGVVLQDSGTPGTANVSLNLFRRILVLFNTGWGLSMTDTDNNHFDWVDLYSVASSGKQGVTMTTPHPSGGSDHFRYLNTNGGSIVVGAGYQQAWFDDLDRGNGTPYPTLSGGGTAFWQTNVLQRSLVPNMSGNCGTNAITADITDGSNANCRGAYAIDLQQERSGVGQVASGANAILLGGQNNSATQAGCVVLGYVWNDCDGNYSHVYGSFARSMGRQGMFNWSNFQLNRTGDAEAGLTVLAAMSSDTNAHRLTSDDSGTANANNCFNLTAYSTYAFTLLLTAQDVTTPGNRQATTYPLAMMGEDANAAATTLQLGTPATLTQGTTGTFATPSADTTNGCLNVTWTAPNSDTWKAVARIVSAETGR